MNKWMTLIVVLLQVITVQTQTCQSPNFHTFLKKLESLTQYVISSTVISPASPSICNGLVTNCCAVSYGQSIVQDLISIQRNSLINFVTNLASVSFAMNKIQVIANLENITAWIAKIPANHLGNATAEQALAFLNYHKSYEKDFATFVTGAPTCFNTISLAIQRIMCYGCDNTKAAKFFGETLVTIPVTQTSCDALVTACATTWRFINNVGWMMQIVAALNKLKKADAQEPAIPSSIYYAGVSTSDGISAVTACGADPSASACDTTKKTFMCKAFFNLFSPPARISGANMGIKTSSAYRRILASEINNGDLAIDTPTGVDITTGGTFPPLATVPALTTTSWSLGYITPYVAPTPSTSSSAATSSSTLISTLAALTSLILTVCLY